MRVPAIDPDLLWKAWTVVAAEDIQVHHVETVQDCEADIVPGCFTKGREVPPRCFTEVALPWNGFTDLEQQQAESVVGTLSFEQPDADKIVDHSIHGRFAMPVRRTSAAALRTPELSRNVFKISVDRPIAEISPSVR